MRLFLAIELADAMKRSLQRMADELSGFRRSVRWVSEKQMHLTLKFLGDVPDERTVAVIEACERVATECKPFELTLDSAGCFPKRGPVGVIWGGSSIIPPALSACVARSEDLLAELGFSRESRPFSVHMTIGRVRHDDTQGRLRKAVNDMRVRVTRQNVASLTLFRSQLGPGGARYIDVGHYPFGGAD